MAIYTSKKPIFTPEDLKYVSTLDIPVLSLTELDKANKTKQGYLEQEVADAKINFEKAAELEDKVLGIKVDTAKQLGTVEALKNKYGIGPNTFTTLDAHALKSPFEVRGIGARINKLINDKDFVEVQRQRFLGEGFKSDINKIEDPALREQAIIDYDKYKKDQLSADKLNIKDYASVDINKEIDAAVKLVTEQTTADFYKSEDNQLEGVRTVKQRSVDSVNKMLASTIANDHALRRNLIAKGFLTEDGLETDKFKKYKEDLITQYTTPNITIDQVKEVGDNKGAGGSGAVSQTRFGTGSENERFANILDNDIANAGYELPDAATVLRSASANGVIKKDEKGAYIELHDKDGKPLTEYKRSDPTDKNSAEVIDESSIVRLTKSTKKQGGARNQMSLDLTGSAFKDVTTIVGNKESTGNYSAYAPSIQTGAVGKYQFIYSDYEKEIKQALDEVGVDYSNYPINPKIVKTNKQPVAKDSARVMSAFLASPEAQEKVWESQYSRIYNQALDLAADGYGGDHSITELMYMLHHEGTPQNVKDYLRTGKSNHDDKNPNSTYEMKSSINTIRNTLLNKGYSGEINEDGSMQKLGKDIPEQTGNTLTPLKDL
jgi:hypothetical protein